MENISSLSPKASFGDIQGTDKKMKEVDPAADMDQDFVDLASSGIKKVMKHSIISKQVLIRVVGVETFAITMIYFLGLPVYRNTEVRMPGNIVQD